jgi:hypothetical protein
MKETKRKKARREEALKRNKRKKILLAAGCVAAAAVIITLLTLNVRRQGSVNAGQQSEERIFTDGRQTVTLYGNGAFAAQLLHNNKKDGTYRETTEGSSTMVIFFYQGTTVNARLVNNALLIPDEWDDSHGHNKILRLK